MRILVTGGAGFIGSHVVDTYLAAGHQVAVVDSLWARGGGKRTNIPPSVPLYDVDVASPALATVFERERPDVVNHHAAQPSVSISVEHPDMDARVNILGLLNILEQCRLHSVRKVLFASSGATYGTPTHLPIHEQTPQLPESPYGITKLAAEHYLRYYSTSFGLAYTAFRYSNVYGPRQDPNGEAGVIAIFTHRILMGLPVRIDADGEQTRDFVYVGDVARANVLALERGDNQIYCVGTGLSTSINQLYGILARLVGRDSPVMYAPRRRGDIRAFCYDNSRARRELGWFPEIDLDTGLTAMVAYIRSQIASSAMVMVPPHTSTPLPVSDAHI